MNHATTCKFCRIPITVNVDDTYADLGDPHKLLPILCCDRCSDLRIERRKLESVIGKVAMNLHIAGERRSAEMIQQSRRLFVVLTQKYATMISKWNGMSGMSWSEECVDLLMDKPHYWSQITQQLWALFKDANKARDGSGTR